MTLIVRLFWQIKTNSFGCWKFSKVQYLVFSNAFSEEEMPFAQLFFRDFSFARLFNCATSQSCDISFVRHFNCATSLLRDNPFARLFSLTFCFSLAQVGCRAVEMSRKWNVAQLKCRADGISRNQNVAQMRYRAKKVTQMMWITPSERLKSLCCPLWIKMVLKTESRYFDFLATFWWLLLTCWQLRALYS